MKALQVINPRKFIQTQTAQPNLKAAGCGSDIPFFTGNKYHKTYPLPISAPIHECVGRVIESTSSLFKPGDQVVAIPEGD